VLIIINKKKGSILSEKSKKNKEKKYPIGGQALIEGVMMRGKDSYSIALLNKSGEVTVTSYEHKAISERIPLFKIPFLRGIGGLFDSMKIGIKALMFSANAAIEEDEAEKETKKERSKRKQKFESFLLGLTSIVFALGLFVAVPNIVIHLLGVEETQTPVFFNILSGIMRIAIFIAYVLIISLMKDVKRVFQYHGAEHKAVNAYEAGGKVELDVVKKYTTFHPRCGTSFMFFVLLVAILVFSFVPIIYMNIAPGFASINIFLRKTITILSNFLLLPLVAGISYELLKLTYIGRNNIIIKILSLPGYGIQKITTSEPNEDMLRCAIAAINAVIKDSDKEVKDEAAA
jgi:uncharacterized protein YqhQ